MKTKIRKSSLLLLSILTLLAFTQKTLLPEVKTVSAMKKVMMGYDLSVNISWDTLPKQNLFAIAPLGRIQGEVTVIDGVMYSSIVDANNKVVISQDWNIQSPFAVYAQVSAWDTFTFKVKIKNEEELQTVIEKLATKNGYDLNKAFPFRVIGEFSNIDYHIISKPLEEKEHNHELHNKAKKHFKLSKVKGELLGFYSKHHEGVFTHKGDYIHTHFIDDKREHMGHIENLKTKKTIIILLPKIN